MGKLSVQPVLSGLARNKIIITAIIISIITMGMIFFGTIYNTDDDSIVENTEQNHNNISNQSVDAVLNSANQKIAQANASQAAKLNQLAMNHVQTSAPVASGIVDHKQSLISNDVIVPPISDTDAQQYKTQEVQIENQFKLKQLQNLKSAYASKSVLYTNNKEKLNASGTIANSYSNIAQPKNQQATSSDTIETRSANNDGTGSTLALNNPSTQNQDQNNQQEKQKFAIDSADKTVNGQSGQYLSSRITDLNSPYVLSAGSVLPSTMISGLNSDLPGQIVGMIRENIYDSPTHRILLIPQGAKLVGLYDSSITYGQERILVAWNRLIYPDGSSINLKAMPGTDIEGYAGFYDEVDNHYWKIFGSSFIMGVITGAMQYSQNNTNANTQSGGIGFTNPNPSVGQTLSGSLGQQLGQTGLTITQKNINIQPTLIVKPGYPFNVMTTADMILRPYRKNKL